VPFKITYLNLATFYFLLFAFCFSSLTLSLAFNPKIIAYFLWQTLFCTYSIFRLTFFPSVRKYISGFLYENF